MSPALDADGGALRRRGPSRAQRPGLGPGGRPALVATVDVGYDALEQSQYLGEPVEAYRFTSGATEYRYTSADVDLVVAGATYTRETIARDAIDYSNEDNSATISVRLPRTNPVGALFTSYLPPAPVALTIFRKHRGDPEVVVRFVGRVLSWGLEGPAVVLTCAPISQMLRRKVPMLVFQSHCNWPLYSPGCTVARASFKVSGTVTEATGPLLRAAVFATKPDGWFRNGWVEVTSGGQLGQRRFVVQHVGDAVTLMNPFTGSVVGATVDGFAGCDRTEATCAAKFSNLVNHMGWPRIPTRNPFGASIDGTGGQGAGPTARQVLGL